MSINYLNIHVITLTTTTEMYSGSELRPQLRHMTQKYLRKQETLPKSTVPKSTHGQFLLFWFSILKKSTI